MTCPAYPFAMTAHSESIQNLGCLPSAWEIMLIQRDTGKNWGCHENESRPCAGQVEWCRESGIPYKKDSPLASYKKWYRDGEV